ncbi:uncharacterized protein LOC119941501 [Tachyglossus aculeatus]|uniref:uncharacterized protein LOC119941501 n=1 Tax=Tachyglossus aculeatus TaxID=9261 RepID=UPI0018F5C4A8|nr:uncharacterized protein LOC119941501 [Tachyglossus aculeatus]
MTSKISWQGEGPGTRYMKKKSRDSSLRQCAIYSTPTVMSRNTVGKNREFRMTSKIWQSVTLIGLTIIITPSFVPTWGRTWNKLLSVVSSCANVDARQKPFGVSMATRIINMRWAEPQNPREATPVNHQLFSTPMVPSQNTVGKNWESRVTSKIPRQEEVPGTICLVWSPLLLMRMKYRDCLESPWLQGSSTCDGENHRIQGKLHQCTIYSIPTVMSRNTVGMNQGFRMTSKISWQVRRNNSELLSSEIRIPGTPGVSRLLA